MNQVVWKSARANCCGSNRNSCGPAGSGLVKVFYSHMLRLSFHRDGSRRQPLAVRTDSIFWVMFQ